MMEIIAKILFCLVAAAFLGFAIGWIFASLFKNEKLEAKLTALHDQIDNEKETINQLQNDYEAKAKELAMCEERYKESQRELLSLQMDQEQSGDTEELRHKNALLQEQLGEQKLLEEENSMLKEELRTLEEEKERLLQKISDLEKEDIHRMRDALERTAKENTLLSEETASLKAELASKTELLSRIEEELQKARKEVENLDKSLAERLPALQRPKPKKRKKRRAKRKAEKERAVPTDIPVGKEELCEEPLSEEAFGFEKTDLSHLIQETFQKSAQKKRT